MRTPRARKLARRVLSTWVVVALLLALTWLAAQPSRAQPPLAPMEPPALPAFPTLPPPAAALSAGGRGQIHFASASPFDLQVLLSSPDQAIATTGVATLLLPEAASASARVPAVVLLHGSGGISPGRERSYGQMLAGRGYAALIVDSYRPRGVTAQTPYLLRVQSVTEFDVASDAYAALRILGTHPAIDPERVALLGFSYGGMAVRVALDARVREALAPDLPRFAAHVDYYGPCYFDLGTRRTTGAPLLTQRGGRDASNDLVACARQEAALRAAGSAVDAVIYSEAGHAWEIERPRARVASPYIAGCSLRYDESGWPWLGDDPLPRPSQKATRAQRSAVRSAGMRRMEPTCLREGYVIGRDEAVRARSDRALLAFLERWLR